MQRVAIARAIVTEPSVLFADEPTGNLDTARSIEIMDLLVSFNRERGLTVVMVTHEADMAAYASRTIRFRDGHVESDERSHRSVRLQADRDSHRSVRLQADRDAGVH
jgi:putative ABC transport system ATP-binding protein